LAPELEKPPLNSGLVAGCGMSKDPLDALYGKVARKILTETLRVQKGESVTVEAWDNGLPFARRTLAEARALGCTAVLVYEDEGAYVEGVRRAPEDSVGKMGKNEYGLLAGTDAYVFIPGQALGPYSKTLKPEERERSTRYNASWYEAAEKAGLRGARLTFGYVGKDLARLLGRKVPDIVKGQLGAALTDFGQISSSTGKVSPSFSDGASVEVESGRSKLAFTLRGELSIDDGVVDESDKKSGNNVAYIPPGLLTKEVDPESANGAITISDSLTKLGVIHHAELEFKNGRLVAWESDDGAKLKTLLEGVPQERRKLVLLGVGFNPAMRYGLGQDRFVLGALTIAGFGFTGVAKKATLRVAGSTVLQGGKLPA
jgi:leucyl aminopeptidase (aminopeptidase T)